MNMSSGHEYYDRCLLIWVTDMNTMIGAYELENWT